MDVAADVDVDVNLDVDADVDVDVDAAKRAGNGDAWCGLEFGLRFGLLHWGKI